MDPNQEFERLIFQETVRCALGPTQLLTDEINAC
jgi:hypothetical protein